MIHYLLSVDTTYEQCHRKSKGGVKLKLSLSRQLKQSKCQALC